MRIDRVLVEQTRRRGPAVQQQQVQLGGRVVVDGGRHVLDRESQRRELCSNRGQTLARVAPGRAEHVDELVEQVRGSVGARGQPVDEGGDGPFELLG